jgi:hypothetical protein
MNTQKQKLDEAVVRAERAEAEVARLRGDQQADTREMAGQDQSEQRRSVQTKAARPVRELSAEAAGGRTERGAGEEELSQSGVEEGGVEELRKDSMMSHLLDSLEAGKDIGHYGRLVFAMVARHFLPAEEVLDWLMRDPDFSEEKARTMLAQVEQRDYNPPKRERILEWQAQQEFPILPDPDDPNCGNLYRNLKFPDGIYHHIEEYQEQKLGVDSGWISARRSQDHLTIGDNPDPVRDCGVHPREISSA